MGKKNASSKKKDKAEENSTSQGVETPSESDRSAAIGVGTRIYKRLRHEHKLLVSARESDQKYAAANEATDQKKRVAKKKANVVAKATAKAKAALAALKRRRITRRRRRTTLYKAVKKKK